MEPSIVDFDDLREFLNAHAGYKRNASKTWTLGAWARKLGLKHKATLSRVLAGQRDAGPDLLRRLQDYFAFDARQREYFALLATLSSQGLDENVQAALRAELAATRWLIVTGPENDDLLQVDDGVRFSIHGFADVNRVNAVLASRRLVVSPFMGRAMVSLSIASYSATNFGPFAEAHVTVVAVPAGANPPDVGLAFSHHRCNHARVAGVGRLVVGSGYALEELSLSYEAGRIDAQSRLFSAIGEHPAPTDPFCLETWGFPSMLGGRVRFKVRIEGKRSQQLLRQAVQWTPHAPMKELMDEVAWVPDQFSVMTGLRMRVARPNRVT